MIDAAINLFKTVYQATDGSTEVAILELKRAGWNQVETVSVVEQVFAVTNDYAQQLVANSIAWQ